MRRESTEKGSSNQIGLESHVFCSFLGESQSTQEQQTLNVLEWRKLHKAVFPTTVGLTHDMISLSHEQSLEITWYTMKYCCTTVFYSVMLLLSGWLLSPKGYTASVSLVMVKHLWQLQANGEKHIYPSLGDGKRHLPYWFFLSNK